MNSTMPAGWMDGRVKRHARREARAPAGRPPLATTPQCAAACCRPARQRSARALTAGPQVAGRAVLVVGVGALRYRLPVGQHDAADHLGRDVACGGSGGTNEHPKSVTDAGGCGDAADHLGRDVARRRRRRAASVRGFHSPAPRRPSGQGCEPSTAHRTPRARRPARPAPCTLWRRGPPGVPHTVCMLSSRLPLPPCAFLANLPRMGWDRGRVDAGASRQRGEHGQPGGRRPRPPPRRLAGGAGRPAGGPREPRLSRSQAGRARGPGSPKVGQLDVRDVALPHQQQIVQLHVAVHDAPARRGASEGPRPVGQAPPRQQAAELGISEHQRPGGCRTKVQTRVGATPCRAEATGHTREPPACCECRRCPAAMSRLLARPTPHNGRTNDSTHSSAGPCAGLTASAGTAPPR